MKQKKPVLVIRYSALGDILSTLRPLALYNKENPDRPIHFLTDPGLIPLLKNCPFIQTLWERPIKLSDWLKLFKNLKQKKYAKIYDLQGKLPGFLLSYLLQIPFRRFGSRSVWEKFNWVLFKSFPIIPIKSQRVSLKYGDALGIGKKSHLNSLTHLPGTLENFRKFNPGGPILIHPFARHQGKENFPLFQKISQLLVGLNLPYAWIGQGEIPFSNPGGEMWCNRFTLLELTEKLGSSPLLITTDSGPMHLASEIGTPTLALFFQTDPRLGFAPPKGCVKIFSTQWPCKPCSFHGDRNCPLEHWNCKGSGEFKKELDFIQQNLPITLKGGVNPPL